MKSNTKYFKPLGPFDINFENLPGGKRITKDHVTNFWNSKTDLVKIGKGRGVYIFGMKVTAGVLPCYVGKTKKSFENECFTARNMITYNGEILRYERNYKPFMFFLAYQPQKKQKISDSVIRELEEYSINLAAQRNPDLANTRGVKSKERFSLSDLGGGRGGGAPTKQGTFFKKMMGF